MVCNIDLDTKILFSFWLLHIYNNEYKVMKDAGLFQQEDLNTSKDNRLGAEVEYGELGEEMMSSANLMQISLPNIIIWISVSFREILLSKMYSIDI